MKKIIFIAALLMIGFDSSIFSAGLSPKFRIYFNQAVNTSVSSGTNAISVGPAMMDTLINYINLAKKTIDIAQYEYSSYPNLDSAVNQAYARGVVVRWIYDASGTNTALSGLNSGIHTLGRPVNSSNYIMHNKFVIIDAGATDSTQTWLYTGSMDWNTTQVNDDYNNIIIIQSQQLAKAYTAQFNQMWGGTGPAPVTASEKFGSAKTSMGPHIFTIDGIKVELYFSPTDSTNTHIIDMLHSANSQLFFGVYTFTEAPDADTINAKYNAGVYTYGIVDQYSEGYAAYTAMNPVLGTTHLKVYANSNYIYHNKYAIADACNAASDPQVLTGSHNWTTGANTGNDENTLIIHDPAIANIYYQAFSSDFTALGGTITGCQVTTNCNNVITSTIQTNSNVLCYGGATGQATIHATGTGVPFTYAWSQSGQTDSVLSNVASGNYTVTITDKNSCSVTASVTISQPAAALSVTTNPVAVSCYGDSNGSVSTTVTGGTAGYHYTWSTTPQQTTAAATAVIAGTYKVTVTDANSCTITASAVVGSAAQITETKTITNVTCFGGDNGSIAVVASGGDGSYSYAWSTSPRQTTATANNLTSGTYKITITDNNNCTATASYSVTQPNSGITLSTNNAAATCGSSNGSANVTVTSGGSSFTYSWNTGASSAAISGLAAGSYTVTVTGTGGCTATAIAIVNSTGGPVISATAIGTTCGKANGGAAVNVNSGSGPFSYKWSNDSTVFSINNLTSGTYTITVTDVNNCPAIASVTVGTSSAPALSVSSTNATCGNSNGGASVSAAGGQTPYIYTWSNADTGAAISNLITGNYNVTVTDNSGCSASATVTVGATGSGGSVLITAGSASICYGDSAQICAPGGYINYQWSNGGNDSCINVNQSGTYTLTATSNGNCNAASNAVQVIVHNAPQITIAIHGDTISSSSFTSYQWFLNGQAIAGAMGSFYVATQSGNYSVFATDSNGCTITSTPQYVVFTGINNLSATNIRIYPNPSASYYQLDVPDEWIGAQYELLDAGGKQILKSTIKTALTTIDAELAQGVYLLKISSGQQSVVKKIIRF